jgi:hypothetical protein
VNPPPDPGQRPNPFEPPPVGSYGYGSPVGPYATKAAPASGEAVAALICGVMAWGCFPLGFLALWLGARARRAVRENPNYVGGDQLALAGMIVGGIFAALGSLLLLLYLAFFVFAIGLHAFHK